MGGISPLIPMPRSARRKSCAWPLPNRRPAGPLVQHIAAAFRWTKRETGAGFSSPHKMDTAKQALYAQIPVHPQELWAGTQYDAELKQPLELTGQDVPAPVPVADLGELKLTGNIEARLVDPVDSSTATAGMPVEAVLTQPLFEDEATAALKSSGCSGTGSAQAHGKLLLPEGTHLIGSVVQAKPAGMFGHNGSLRLTFRKAELPEGDERVVHGQVIAAESVKSDRLQIDNEGQVKANGANRFLAPITLGSLAAVSDSTGAGLIKEAMTSNGLDLLARVMGTASWNGGLIAASLITRSVRLSSIPGSHADMKSSSPRTPASKSNSPNDSQGFHSSGVVLCASRFKNQSCICHLARKIHFALGGAIAFSDSSLANAVCHFRFALFIVLRRLVRYFPRQISVVDSARGSG